MWARGLPAGRDADGVFPGLSKKHISKLISKNPSNQAPPHLRDKYEARDAVDESDSDSESDFNATVRIATIVH